MGARSNDSSGLMIFGGIIVIFAFIAIFAYYSEKKRKDAIKNYCMMNGLEFSEGGSYIPNCDIEFKITSKGHFQNFYNIMTGEKAGIRFSIIDFYYHTGGKNGNHNSTICVLSKPGVDFPNFYMRPEIAIMDWLGEKLGGQDIDFSEDPAFSNKFVLQGSNEQEIRKFFTPEVREAFVLNQSRNMNEFEASEDYFLVYQNDFLDINKRLELLNYSMKIFSAIIPKTEENLA